MLIESIKPKTDQNGIVQKTKNGETKYSVMSNGEKYTAYGDWIVSKVGQDVPLRIKDEIFMGVQYKTVWPPQAPVGSTAAPKLTEPNHAPEAPVQPKLRDFEAEAEGKCRHAYLVEAFIKDLPLTPELLMEVNRWTEASMTGRLE